MKEKNALFDNKGQEKLLLFFPGIFEYISSAEALAIFSKFEQFFDDVVQWVVLSLIFQVNHAYSNNLEHLEYNFQVEFSILDSLCQTIGLLPDYCIAMASCHYSGLSHEISLEIFTRLKMPACNSSAKTSNHLPSGLF